MSGEVISAINLPPIAHYPGSLERLPEWIREIIGTTGDVVLVSGESTLNNLPQVQHLFDDLAAQGWRIHLVYVAGEPSPEFVDEQLSRLPRGRADIIIAIGGGSVLDCAKSMAAIACEQGPTKSFLEGVGDRLPSGHRLPWIAVPTTMGTGSEATHNAVLGQPALSGGYKKSLRHPAYVADRVILDAQLNAALPARTVASAGMDAFSQLLESYLAPSSSPLLDRWLRYGLELASYALPQLIRRNDQEDRVTQRHAMALAATISGVGLTATGLGTVHGLIGPIGAVANVSHGLACANVLPPTMRFTLDQARSRGGEEESFVEARLSQIGAIVLSAQGETSAESDAQKADALVLALYEWRDLAREQSDMPALASCGFTAEHLEAVIGMASNRRNPVELNQQQWREILLDASH